MKRFGVLGFLLSLAACSSQETAAPGAGAGTAGTGHAGTSGTGGTAGTGGAGGASGSPGCGSTAASMRDCVEKARLTEDLTFVAAERTPGSPHWQAVQDLCKQRFEQNGFTVELEKYASGVNVVGKKLGQARPDEEVLLSAHYDHIPGCAGADDNATGVVGVLEAARVVGAASFARTLVLACWDEEEDGLIGAEAYAARAKANGENVAVMYSLEMLGYRSTEPNSQRVPGGFDALFPAELATLHANQDRADFLAILPDTAARPVADRLAEHAKAIGLSAMVLEITAALKSNPLAGDVRRSDHAAFWDQDIPAILVTDTSEFRYDPYHCRSGPDVIENLDLEFLTLNVRATVGSVVDALAM